MGYVFEHQDGVAYARQQETPGARAILASQIALLRHMLQPQRGQRLLDVGCGIGHMLHALDGTGLHLTGLDASAPVLDMARGRLPQRIDLHLGQAESLPFDDNEFHFVSLLHTLEFVEDPVKTLAEACRVAKEAVYIGLVNKHAPLAAGYRIRGICMPTLFNRARFFSIWQIRRQIKRLLGPVPVDWCTLYLWPPRGGPEFKPRLPRGWCKRLPFGSIAGIKIVPAPRFRTTPLTLKLKIKPAKRWVESGTCNGASVKPRTLDQRRQSDESALF